RLSLLVPLFFCCSLCGAVRVLHSFPTRRSSDLGLPPPSLLRQDPPAPPRRRARSRRSPRVSPRDIHVARVPGFRVASRAPRSNRSEEHTSELQSHLNLVCRLLLEKKKNNQHPNHLNINFSTMTHWSTTEPSGNHTFTRVYVETQVLTKHEQQKMTTWTLHPQHVHK